MDAGERNLKRLSELVEYVFQDPDESAGVVHRALHRPSLGLVRGEFAINAGLPAEIAHGLFAEPRSFVAWTRFSRAHFVNERIPDTIGMAVKLLDVPGEPCLAPTAGEQDFILANIPFPWVGNLDDVLRYFEVLADNKRARANRRSAGAEANAEGRRRVHQVAPANYVFPSLNPASFVWPLIRLWPVITWKWLRRLDIGRNVYGTSTPCRLGDGAMKVFMRPSDGQPRMRLRGSHRERLRRRLAAGPLRFDCLVQRRTMPRREPLDDATRVWRSPLVKAATLHIPSQDFDTEERRSLDASIGYSPYNALMAHEPLGSLNHARRWAYSRSARNRGAICPFRPAAALRKPSRD